MCSPCAPSLERKLSVVAVAVRIEEIAFKGCHEPDKQRPLIESVDAVVNETVYWRGAQKNGGRFAPTAVHVARHSLAWKFPVVRYYGVYVPFRVTPENVA
jgi:hypothetical protein